MDKLETGMAYRLVLIVAPQGAGKTRLLRQWIQLRSNMGFPAAVWISLEEQDNDPGQFLEHFMTACSQIDPQLVSRLQPLGQVEKRFEVQINRQGRLRPGASNSEDLLIDLINALAELPYEIALVMDEYYRIESPEIHQAVSFFIDYLPKNVHVYLAARREPGLRIAHLRARREVCELGPSELFEDAKKS